MKKILKFMFQRVVLVSAFIFIQAVILIAAVLKFNNNFIYFYFISTFLSAVAVLWLVSSKTNPGYKIAWIILILVVPIFGGLFYILYGGNKLNKWTKRKMTGMAQKMYLSLKRSEAAKKTVLFEDEHAVNQSRYIEYYAFCPPYQHTQTEYLPLGEIKFHRLLEELAKAEHYIFLEYFIIEEGIMWNAVLEILVQKVKSGVDVRVIFDDLGCITTLPYHYHKKLENMGIQCCVFNPYIPILSLRFNTRDHRKIAVIDGHTGFTGGINLADEYINAYKKYGHWKDCSILLRGDAVWSLTVMFLTMWDYLRGSNEIYDNYRPEVHQTCTSACDGVVQPFADNPLDDEPVGETVYLNLINKARRYIYINTPYLIIDNEIATALYAAAKSGVDVRIVTPHIPDKHYVHAVTRANYEMLIESGVEIYEYTPGFMHAKTFVVDDEYAVVGTINLDFRSLYLHFECATWLYHTQSVLQVKDDFLKTLLICHKIVLLDCKNVKWYIRVFRSILRIFAPLM